MKRLLIALGAEMGVAREVKQFVVTMERFIEKWVRENHPIGPQQQIADDILDRILREAYEELKAEKASKGKSVGHA